MITAMEGVEREEVWQVPRGAESCSEGNINLRTGVVAATVGRLSKVWPILVGGADSYRKNAFRLEK